jgi:hypothetical protein
MDATYGNYGSVRRVTCWANLKQTAVAAGLYAADFDDRLMPSDRWMDCLTSTYRTSSGVRKEQPLLNFEGALRCNCLVGNDRDKSRYGYAYNSRLSSRRLSEIENPDTTPLAYESSNWQRNAADPFTSFTGPFDPAVAESRRANIAYVSGRVERAE